NRRISTYLIADFPRPFLHGHYSPASDREGSKGPWGDKRGNCFHFVIPAKAGIQGKRRVLAPWTPAFAGVTNWSGYFGANPKSRPCAVSRQRLRTRRPHIGLPSVRYYQLAGNGF